MRRFWVSCVRPGHCWAVEIMHGFEGNYEYEYAYFRTWVEAYDHALKIAKKWRYPEGWYR